MPQGTVLDQRLDLLLVQVLVDLLVVGGLVVGQGLDTPLGQVGHGLPHQRLDLLVVTDLGVGDAVGQRHLVLDIDQQVMLVAVPLDDLGDVALVVLVLLLASTRLSQPLGHLKGNRFAIRLRHVSPTDVVKVAPVLKTIAERGLPNYFGEQRFGRRGDNHLLGAAIIRSDPKGLLDQLLGKPMPTREDPQTTGARKAYDRNDPKRQPEMDFSLGMNASDIAWRTSP